MQCWENKIWSAVSDYICKMKIHIAERQSLEDTVLSLREQLRPESSHLSSHLYNIVRSAETLLDRKARVCGSVGTNKGHSTWPECETNHLTKGQSVFWRKDDVIVQVLKDKETCANEKHNPWQNSSEHRKERQNRLGNRETLCYFSA